MTDEAAATLGPIRVGRAVDELRPVTITRGGIVATTGFLFGLTNHYGLAKAGADDNRSNGSHRNRMPGT